MRPSLCATQMIKAEVPFEFGSDQLFFSGTPYLDLEVDPSVNTKEQSRLKYSHSLPVMSIPFLDAARRGRTWLPTASFPPPWNPTVAYSRLHPPSPPGPSSSPVWVPMYWRGTLSTRHVHTMMVTLSSKFSGLLSIEPRHLSS